MDHNPNGMHPSISLITGSFLTILTFFAEHGFFIENILQLFKVVVVGIIGGASGYLGKLIVIAINRKIKKQKV